MNLTRKLVFTGCLIWSAGLLAADLSYDYIDAGVTFGEVDTIGDDVDFTGFDVSGSWGFHRNFAMALSLGVGEIDVLGDVDTTSLSLGVTPHFPITPQIDVVIPVAFEWLDLDAGRFSDDDTGYSVGIGIRARPADAFEFNVGFRHVDIFDDDDQSLVGGARWHLNDLFSLSLDGSLGDDASAIRLGGRFSF